MGYKSMQACVADLEKHGHLVRILEEVDPNLEMAAIHRRVFEAGGPAVFYENVKGSPFTAVSNLFGTIERSNFLFRDTLARVKQLVGLKADPMKALKKPFQHLSVPFTALNALPMKARFGKRVLSAVSKSSRAALGRLPIASID